MDWYDIVRMVALFLFNFSMILCVNYIYRGVYKKEEIAAWISYANLIVLVASFGMFVWLLAGKELFLVDYHTGSGEHGLFYHHQYKGSCLFSGLALAVSLVHFILALFMKYRKKEN